jgi:hypothetical protein
MVNPFSSRRATGPRATSARILDAGEPRGRWKATGAVDFPRSVADPRQPRRDRRAHRPPRDDTEDDAHGHIDERPDKPALAVERDGFNLHAGVRIEASDDLGRERLAGC